MQLKQLANPSTLIALAFLQLLWLTGCDKQPEAPEEQASGEPSTNGSACEASQPWADGYQSDNCLRADGSEPIVDPTYWQNVCIPNLQGWRPTQTSFDQLSWRSFFYASWPAAANGKPDTSKHLGDTAGGKFLPTVWESYKNAEDLFGDSGSELTAADYSVASSLPNGCDPQGPRVLSMTSKTPLEAIRAVSAALTTEANAATVSALSGINQAFTGPLFPQGPTPLMPVFYEIRINDVEYNAIINAGAQNKSPAELNCTGKYANPGCKPFSFPLQSEEVKAAWKVLSAEEVSSGGFYHQDLQVKDPATGQCSVKPMGLVGLHIARKVQAAIPEQNPRKNAWAWSTFEHHDNVPPVGSDGSGGTYSFYDPTCTPAVDAAKCAAAKRPTEDDPDPVDEGLECCPNLYRYGPGFIPANPVPIQVTRIDQSPPQTQTCNQVYDKAGDRGVFDNYDLVVTQWPKQSDGTGPSVVTPTLARNTVIETYFTKWHDGTQVSTSSCMSCHSGGSAVDMSYLFLNNS